MKYTYHNEHIQQEARRELNDKILYLVEKDLAEQSGITREDIYNAYTGDGGLHGLKRSDFANYHSFSEAKKEIENGQFFTPPAICQFIMDALSPSHADTVADLTSGISTFANFMPVEANFYGCELDIKSHKVAHYLYPDANLEHGDIRFYQPDMRFDYIVGNPPFNLKWSTEHGEIISQMYYCIKAAQLLKPLGIMAIVVPASFLADDMMDAAKRKEIEQMFSFLGEVSIAVNTFSYLGVDNFPTKIQFWQRKLDKIIIPELHYNNARMSQFYMRFVRFTSTEQKDIYFVTYSGSIESNQMQMVLAKEKLNLFMKGQDVDLDEIYNRFGVGYDLMSLLMSREQDEDGTFRISWGNQSIV